GDYPKTNTYWPMLHDAGADLVLAGHHHDYERFDHMSVVQPAGTTGDHQGQVDPTGPREFVVGTGGGEHCSFNAPTPAVGSQVRIDQRFGVLRLVLHENSYEWQFLAAEDGSVLDSGNDTTHGTFAGSGTPDTTAPGGTTNSTVGVLVE